MDSDKCEQYSHCFRSSHTTRLPSFKKILKFAHISQDERLSCHYTTEDQRYGKVLDTNIVVPTAETFVPSIPLDFDKNDEFQMFLWEQLAGLPLAKWNENYRLYNLKRSHFSQYECKKKVSTDGVESKNSEHSAKEKQRRERHAIMLAIMDALCPYFLVKQASKFLPQWKTSLGHTGPTNQSRTEKGTGKDEVLVGSVFALLMAKWHIEADKQLREKQEDAIKKQQTIISDLRSRLLAQPAPIQLMSPVLSDSDDFHKKRKRN